jgi:hypothetical protein
MRSQEDGMTEQIRGPASIELPGTGWRLWADAALRSAGFPAARLEPFCDARLAASVAAEGYPKEFAAAEARLTAAVREAAADPLLREAVAWQNPTLVSTALDKAIRGEKRNVRGRNHELAVANYVQRYTAKNDTIGFFGPVGWARLDPAGPAMRCAPGPELLRRRTTYFEVWAIDALADTLAARDEVVPWLVPRLETSAVLKGRLLVLPLRKPIRLAVPDAQVLHLCDGERPVRDIVAAFGSVGDALAVLYRLRDLGAIRLGLRGPVHAHPERLLRQHLERIGDPAARSAALAPLDELIAARDAIDTAAGDADKVVAATAQLGDAFRRLTGTDDTRNHGRTYAGRTLVYQDTVRDVEVSLGAPVLAAMALPLGLILDSARWLCATVAERCHELMVAHFHRQRAEGATSVPFSRLFMMTAVDLDTTQSRTLPPLVVEVVAELQRRWAELLGPWRDPRHHEVDSAGLAERASRLFPALPARWTNARQHSPDLMIAAADAEAVTRGEFRIVLGELHLASNTLESRLFVEQHDHPEQLLAAAEHDAAGTRVYAVQRRTSPFVTSRVTPPTALLSEQFRYWTMGDEAVDCPVPPIRAAEMEVSLQDGRLVVCAGDERLDLLEVAGELLTATVADAFRPFADEPHRPRVTIDRFVVSRESWTIAPQDTEWAFVKDEQARYAAARAWVARLGLPDRVFVKVPVESKPSLVDFSSLVLVNQLAKAIRHTHELAAGPVRISEMVPGAGELWLTDARGDHYTSEIRMVASQEVGR